MPIDIYGYVEIVKIINSFQENPNLTNTNGWTPIHSTAQQSAWTHRDRQVIEYKDEIEKINCSKILYSIYPNLKNENYGQENDLKVFYKFLNSQYIDIHMPIIGNVI